MKKKVLIVDDHEIFRMGVVGLLSTSAGEFDVLEASSCNEAIAVARDEPCDLIILDQNLQDGRGLDVLEILLELCESAHVILLTAILSGSLARQALAAGASAVLAKRGRGEELLKAIDCLARQQPYVGRDFRELMSEVSALDVLTKRELQVLRLLVGGMSTQDVADQLGIGFKTAETHRTRVMGKMGVHSFRELLMKAHEIGLMSDGW